MNSISERNKRFRIIIQIKYHIEVINGLIYRKLAYTTKTYFLGHQKQKQDISRFLGVQFLTLNRLSE